MDESSGRLSRTLWVGMALLIVILCASYLLSHLEPRRPHIAFPPVLGDIADFTLTNQNGLAVSLADLRGHVWVADIIFTRCAGPCPRMTQQMRALQDNLPPTSGARLVTLTTDADFDTAPVLKAYGQQFGANFDRWMFLTGGSQEIAALAIDSLKLTAIEKKAEERVTPEDLFVHSTFFVVVDQQGRLRGVFETVGEGIDPARVRGEILALIAQLEGER